MRGGKATRTRSHDAAELGGVAAFLPDGHAYSECVSDDHGKPADGAVAHVVPFVGVRSRVLCAMGHAQGSVETKRGVSVQGNGGAENVCEQKMSISQGS